MPDPTGTTLTTDQDFLTASLAVRDVPCPLCGYNLRGLTGRHCPECGKGLVMRLEMRQPLRRLHLAAFVIIASGIGFNAMFVAYVGVHQIVKWMLGRPARMAEVEMHALIILAIELVPMFLALWAWQHFEPWLRRQGPAVRLLSLLPCALVPAAGFLTFIHIAIP